MEKILLINGSPRGERSNTLNLSRAFSRGMKEGGDLIIEEITLSRKKIDHCKGCFSCWSKTPGRCILRDDMEELLTKFTEAEVVIWSFPLYYFSMPSLIKAFMDRLLPLNEPRIVPLEDGSHSHPSRVDLSSQKHVLISTCGFPGRDNVFDALEQQFRILFGDIGGHGNLTKILCPEGELFSAAPLKSRTDAYLAQVEQGGREFYRDGRIGLETEKALEELLFPRDVYLEMANNSWDEPEEGEVREKEDSPGRSERFLRQMAALYNPAAHAKDIVLEMHFTDKDETFQLKMDRDKCLVARGNETPFTTRIETPFSLWQDISDGKINGAQAMMDGLYKVRGDFDIMNRMDVLFGSAPEKLSPAPAGDRKTGKTSMNFLLFPWIALWVLLPMEPLSHWGGFAAIALAALVTLAGFRFTLTPYDRITTILVTALGLPTLLGITPFWLISLSYLLFGLMWTLSARRDIPLTAYYSSGKHGGDEARANPLFIKTNRILTDCWGLLYLIIALGSFFMMRSPFKSYTGIICQIGPILMGIFTARFQKWYPAQVAGGRFRE